MQDKDTRLNLTESELKQLDKLILDTWAGSSQLKAFHITSNDEKLLEELVQFLRDDAGSPWVIELRLLGSQSLPDGVWRILSSSAYFRSNIWFVLFSGGMLNPRTKNSYVSTDTVVNNLS